MVQRWSIYFRTLYHCRLPLLLLLGGRPSIAATVFSADGRPSWFVDWPPFGSSKPRHPKPKRLTVKWTCSRTFPISDALFSVTNFLLRRASFPAASSLFGKQFGQGVSPYTPLRSSLPLRPSPLMLWIHVRRKISFTFVACRMHAAGYALSPVASILTGTKSVKQSGCICRLTHHG